MSFSVAKHKAMLLKGTDLNTLYMLMVLRSF